MCPIVIRDRWPSRTACRVSEKTPEITACEAIIVAQVASPISGQSSQLGGQMVERVLQGCGLAQEQGALAEVVEHQGGQDETEPGEADRLRPKWPMSA